MMFTRSARRLGIASALGFLCLRVVYDVTLGVGLSSLPSPAQQIGDPYFSALEVLIILMMPPLVTLMLAVHAWAPSHAKVFTLTALIFTTLLAGLTTSLHVVVLIVSRQAALAELSWLPVSTSFQWPSVAYALDILAWDVFFALSMLFA